MMLTAQEIAATVHQITQGIQSRLTVPAWDALLLYNGDTETTTRDFIRQSFLDLGVEIEFSGKGNYEKGVVIDMDAEKLNELGLNPDTLRFGQTVVKVGLV